MENLRNRSSAPDIASHVNGREAARPRPRSRINAPLVTPIVQSTTFVQPEIGEAPPHAYSRVANPTVDALEAVLGELEDAPPAVTFSTGLGAELTLFLALLEQGDHVVCGDGVYGGTVRLLRTVLSSFGIETTFINCADPQNIRNAITPRTKLVFVESPTNPLLTLVDIEAVAAICEEAKALLIVDNTFQTAALQRPLDLGADATVCSTTKFIDGHSVALGGSIVARDEALLDRVRFLRKCIGSIQTPFNAWLTLQGLKTLDLRLRHQSATAQRIAEWLNAHPEIERVLYPGLERSPQRELAAKQHIDRCHGAVVTFEVQRGLEGARDFVRELQLCKPCEHVGSVETLITHPATMTHADVPREHRLRVGLTDGLVRLSVGLEDAALIIADLDQALLESAATTKRDDRAARVVVVPSNGPSTLKREVTPCLTTA